MVMVLGAVIMFPENSEPVILQKVKVKVYVKFMVWVKVVVTVLCIQIWFPKNLVQIRQAGP